MSVIIDGIRRRAAELSSVDKVSVMALEYATEWEREGSETSIARQRRRVQNDFSALVQNSADKCGNNRFVDWTPQEIKLLYGVLYGQPFEE